jgi:hypothetical protein
MAFRKIDMNVGYALCWAKAPRLMTATCGQQGMPFSKRTHDRLRGSRVLLYSAVMRI